MDIKRQNKRTYVVGCIQMDCTLRNKRENINLVADILRQADKKPDIVCLPELFSTGYNLDLIGKDYFKLAETIPGPTTEELGSLGRKYDTTIIGNVVERDQTVDGVLYDTTFLLDSRGAFLGRYRKTHLYPDEHRFFKAGDVLPVFELDGLKAGIAICFEHAFPQIFMMLALRGAEIVFVPSAVPVGYEYLLNLRTRARAQDNQIFVVASNRWGTDGTVTYCGQSKVVNPRGETIAEAGASENRMIVAECDLNLILKERTQEPVFRCLRPDLYRSLFPPSDV